MSSVATLTPEQLRNRFFMEAAPHWHIYTGATGKTMLSKFRDDDNTITEEEKVTYSWMQLEELFRTIDHGYGRIVLRKNPSDNLHLSPQYFITWGRADQNAIGNAISPSTIRNTGGSMEGVFYEKILQMQENAHKQQMELMTSLMQAKFEKERLEEAVEGMGSPSMSEELIRGGVDILKGLVMQPRMQQSTAQLGTLGTEPATEQKTERPFSVDQVVADASVLKQVLPQYHPNDVIRAITLFAQGNPSQAGQYISMLMAQITGNGG